MDFNQLVAKLGRNGLVIAIGGLLAFIASFFPWYGISGQVAEEAKKFGVKTSDAAWSSGFAAWFPMLLLFALGVVAVLRALDVVPLPDLRFGFIEAAAGVLATLLVLLRWLTYDTASVLGSSVGALWGTYVGLIIALAVAVFGYLDFVAKGGDIKNLGAAFNAPSSSEPPQG